MEDWSPPSSLSSSPNNGDGNEKENKMVPSSAAELPTTSATATGGIRTILISSSVFCLFIRWGLPRLITLFNSNSTPPSTASQTQNVADPTPGATYDVFLNHRGPDVKESLASAIYHWLEDRGLRVFLDKEEFQPGEGLHPTIQQAIRSASVHVAIFSKRYAESSWCLDELCSMLKSGAKIIPVFYDVQPYQLRWIGKRKGVYDSGFARHQKNRRVPLQKLVEWKAALHDVSNLHGLELNGSEFKGDLGKLLKRIVDTVSEAVAEKVQPESAKDPVGLDEAIQDFQHFLQGTEQEPVKIVGIVGLGGSGKTTLARHFYNNRRASFTASSFLSEVRHTPALQNLQGQLLNDLLHISDDRIERFGVSYGRVILTNRLRSSTPRVLVILDDIDHENQIENLLPKEVLGSGSLILLTSRDEVALRKSGADTIYKMKPLKSNHALQLFCRHAFQQTCPKRGFEDLAEKFCDKCGGFPLFLKLMGAHLRVTGGDDRDAWHDEVEYIPDDIKNLFKISYDALPREERQMFLDVACFFVGEHKTMAIRLWNLSDRRASMRLKNLERRCLVDVDDKNCLKLHDHLRDFGREIAEQESPCRFWHPRQIINIQQQLQERREVRGIITVHAEYYDNLTFEEIYLPRLNSAFEEMNLPRLEVDVPGLNSTLEEVDLLSLEIDLPRLNSTFEEIDLPRLKFLAIKGDCLENRFEPQITNLMWLRWYECPHTNIPSRWISMKNLTVLHILGGILEKWEVCDTQLPLKELVIQKTRLSYISIDEDICPQLEHLDLSHNKCLVEVEHLPTTLVLLSLSWCTTLKKISASFHMKKLKFLETLGAEGCSKLQTIQGLEHLSKLRHLEVNECAELVELPNLSGLNSLEKLGAEGCSKLQNIQGLEHLSKLRDLDVRSCSELGELPNLSGLTSLETLRAWGCSKLPNIQGLEHLSKLRHLDVRQCSELGQLPNLSGLNSLETLEAWGCSKLQNIQGLEHLPNLKRLES